MYLWRHTDQVQGRKFQKLRTNFKYEIVDIRLWGDGVIDWNIWHCLVYKLIHKYVLLIYILGFVCHIKLHAFLSDLKKKERKLIWKEKMAGHFEQLASHMRRKFSNVLDKNHSNETVVKYHILFFL